MILKQIYCDHLGRASYFIGDEKAKVAVVIDPFSENAESSNDAKIEAYLKLAKEYDLEIRHIFLTHFCIDFLQNYLELSKYHRVDCYLGSRIKANFNFIPLKNGDVLEFQEIRLEVLETPGHTQEAICLLLYNLSENDNLPSALFTGKTLLTGTIGIPNSFSGLSKSKSELGNSFYNSLFDKLLKLPDDTTIYPSYGVGKLLGKQNDSKTTLGNQRKFNHALQHMSKKTFISFLYETVQRNSPCSFSLFSKLSQNEIVCLETKIQKSSLQNLPLEDLLNLSLFQQIQFLDVRHPAEYERAHLKGSIHIFLNKDFEKYANLLLNPEKPIVVITNSGAEKEAIKFLAFLGFKQIFGVLYQGIYALKKHPTLLGKTQKITARELAFAIDSKKEPFILDVRSEKRWNEEHIEGSINIPLARLKNRMGELPQKTGIVVYSQIGTDSLAALNLLEIKGFTNVIDLIGGFEGWKMSGLPRFSAYSFLRV